MEADLDSLRRYYSSLSDEGLLSIDPHELVAMAQVCYQAEIDKRRLKAARQSVVPVRAGDRGGGEIEAAGEPVDGGDEAAWLPEAAEVYSVVDLPGAAAGDAMGAAMSVLKAAGIPCHVEVVEEPEQKYPATRRWRLMVPGNLNLRAMSTLERDMSNPEFEGVWKTHLEALSDRELLAMSPEVVFCGLFDRVQRVTQAYDEELARRGLRPEPR